MVLVRVRRRSEFAGNVHSERLITLVESALLRLVAGGARWRLRPPAPAFTIASQLSDDARPAFRGPPDHRESAAPCSMHAPLALAVLEGRAGRILMKLAALMLASSLFSALDPNGCGGAIGSNTANGPDGGTNGGGTDDGADSGTLATKSCGAL